MARKQTAWKTKGMNRDLSVSAFNPEFSFENRNLRLITNENNTMLSWVNEKGTAEINIVTANGTNPETYSAATITGTAIGTAVIDHKLVVFLTNCNSSPSSKDKIYLLEYLTDVERAAAQITGPAMKIKQLFSGYLRFDVNHPIETLTSFESTSLEKVYWTDWYNQPRMINVAADAATITKYNSASTTLDFVNELALSEDIWVTKELGSGGMFAPGVIQYAFTYYRKNGQETHIFYTTPLLYISYSDRGAAPDAKVENAFRIYIKGIDTKFDYIRIYSIQRTSLNGVPIVKRIQDISIDSNVTATTVLSYLDIGTGGDVVTPTDLLFKGGEVIKAKTIEQKDGTLFLGNIRLDRDSFDLSDLKTPLQTAFSSAFSIEKRSFTPNRVSSSSYFYCNQLTSNITYNTSYKKTVPCGGFKCGDIYRCGVQFQYKTGKWSDPIWLKDCEVNRPPEVNEYGDVSVPTIRASITMQPGSDFITTLTSRGYRKARPVVVFPEMQDRVVVCQGIANPTLYTNTHRLSNLDNDLYAQSSWFFRPYVGDTDETDYSYSRGAVTPKSTGTLRYTDRGVKSGVPVTGSTAYNPAKIRQVEVQGAYSTDNKFNLDQSLLTLHSPDVEFDDNMANVEFKNIECWRVGHANFTNTLSDIEILTETPQASSTGAGFIHKAFSTASAAGIVAGLFYEDFLIDDESDTEICQVKKEKSPVKWMVYPWNKTGSLNNDISRPANFGIASAILKKKTISNLRVANTSYSVTYNGDLDDPDREDIINPTQRTLSTGETPQLFASDEATIIKIGDKIYQGNIDSVVIPDYADGQYFSFGSGSNNITDEYIDTPFTNDVLWKTFSKKEGDDDGAGMWKTAGNGADWNQVNTDIPIGDIFIDTSMKKDPVRIKYKSTPHIALAMGNTESSDWPAGKLPIFELRRNPGNADSDFRTKVIFGGTSSDALKENVWIPCGEPVPLSGTTLTLDYIYGDTYYQRWDCLKTYPFTLEDINQVIEIGSFMLETRVNIDGRYDRNRGQKSNIYVSPRNFNLLNPVYSQKDNFFSYRIHDDDYYKNNTYPNQVTWSLTKQSGADVDVWTDITLASVLELDGNKGEINKLTRYNDQLIAFQDSGIAQILYNENVQIAASNDVPIEIANSGKVQGSRYLSDTIGCSDKWSVVSTPLGVYFMDSNNKGIYIFNGQLSNITLTKGFSSWARQRIPSGDKLWNPLSPAYGSDGFSNFVSYYDKVNQDVLFIDRNEALAFSEKMMVFTSFYDYGGTPYFNNLDDTGVWIRNYKSVDNNVTTMRCDLYKHNAGSYCRFFGLNKPYSMTLVGNPEPQLDKIFTNLEFRACVDGEGTVSSDVFTPSLPFDFLETWDEYQHGIAQLGIRNGHAASLHHLNNTTGEGASLKRDFRIWRCDIPRDNTPKTSEQLAGYNYTLDTDLGITRFSRRPMDRMRNPWLYLKLKRAAAADSTSLPRVEIHDMMMTYFG